MDSGFPQPDVDVTDQLLIGAALLAPAFCIDLSTWRMSIDRNGIIRQELSIAHHSELYERVIIHLQAFAPDEELAKIESHARAMRFYELEDDYHAECTDLEHTSITLNLDGKPKRVTAYGPGLLAHKGNVDMAGYSRLWQMLVAIAPYQNTEAYAAPEDRVRGLMRSLFGPW